VVVKKKRKEKEQLDSQCNSQSPVLGEAMKFVKGMHGKHSSSKFGDTETYFVLQLFLAAE